MLDKQAKLDAIDVVSFRMLRSIDVLPELPNGKKNFVVCFEDEQAEAVVKQVDDYYDGWAYVVILSVSTGKPIDCIVIARK